MSELVFVHIPKTAGSAFRKLLQQIYPPAWETLFDDEPGDELRTFRHKVGRAPRVLTGHLPASVLLPRAPEAQSIVWLRDPVARTISTYFYWQSLEEEPDPRHAKVRSGETTLVQFAEQHANSYAKYWLAGYELGDFDFLGIVEHADEDVAEMAEFFGWGDVRLEKVNRTTTSQYLSFEPTQELLDYIRELNHADVALYERALALRAERRARPRVRAKTETPLVMTLLVRDEADIVEENLLFHLTHGVDFVIATDNGSTDGTVEILERYEREGVLHLIREPADDYSQAQWVTRMARLAARDLGADWVINADADEFWWPKQGSLKTALRSLPADIGLVAAPRLNFLPRPVEVGPFWKRLDLRETRSFADPAIDGPGEKICHRAHPRIEVAQGNHAVSGPELARLEGAEPIVVLHFPLRSFAQVENKIRLGGAAYARNERLDETVGWTWRRLYERHQAGTLREWYDEQVVDDARAAAGIADGSLIVDRRLHGALSRLCEPTAAA